MKIRMNILLKNNIELTDDELHALAHKAIDEMDQELGNKILDYQVIVDYHKDTDYYEGKN